MLISRFIFVYLGLVVFLSLVCLFQSYYRFTSKFEGKASLQELADRLHDAGLEFRVLSPRQDGLASNAIYLTQTDLDDVSIRSLALDSTRMQKWNGTVEVFYESNPKWALYMGDDWGECAYCHGQFVIFGDKVLLKQIERVLESKEIGTSFIPPSVRPVGFSE
jgi:hypothetical protein